MPTGITQPQALALAQLLHQIRPDWPAASLIAHLRSHADHPADFADIAVAAITRATDERVKTPHLIWDQGPHWPERAKPALPRGPRCADHDTFDAHNCPACWGDVRAGDRPENLIGKHHTPATANQGAASITRS